MEFRIRLIPRTLLGLALFAIPALSKVPYKLEPDYADAIIQFNDKNYGRAVGILTELSKKSPDTIEFLELKALALKLDRKPKESAATYERLFRTKKERGASEKELAPYAFELGFIYFSQKEDEKGIRYLKIAADQNFNPGLSNMYLGLMEFRVKNWEQANRRFERVTRSRMKALIPPAHLYRSQIGSKIRNTELTVESLYSARDSSKEILDDKSSDKRTKKVAQQVYDASTKALIPLDKSEWFGTLGLNVAYDTNVLSLPETTPDSQTEGKESAKLLFNNAVGWMSSPVKTIQFVPSYRHSYNYNFNRKSRSAEYLANTLSLYINRKPISVTVVGVKLEGTHTFKNEVQTDDSAILKSYSLSASFGPYVRQTFSNQWTANLELSAGPNKNYQDSSVADSKKRSGVSFSSRLSANKDTGNLYWNPTTSLSFTKNRTKGTFYRSDQFGASIGSVMYFIPNIKLTSVFDASLTRFPVNSDNREDKKFSLRVAGLYKYNKKFAFLGDAKYVVNKSNVKASYQYNQFVASVGATYSLF